jgi:hypothetical protein
VKTVDLEMLVGLALLGASIVIIAAILLLPGCQVPLK